MKPSHLIVLFGLCLLTSGCSSQSAPAPQPVPVPVPTPSPVIPTPVPKPPKPVIPTPPPSAPPPSIEDDMLLFETYPTETLTTDFDTYNLGGYYWAMNATFPAIASWFTSGSLGRQLVNGVDFTQSMDLHTTDFPNKSAVDWRYPTEASSPLGPVYAAPAIVVGECFGGSTDGHVIPGGALTPTPTKVGSLVLSAEFDCSWWSNKPSVDGGSTSIFFEIYPSVVAGRAGTGTGNLRYEFSIYMQCNAATLAYWGPGGGSGLTTTAYSQPGGWTGTITFDPASGFGNGRIFFLPTTPFLTGTFDFAHAFAFVDAMSLAWDTNWYINGIEFLVEVNGNGGGWFVKKLEYSGWF